MLSKQVVRNSALYRTWNVAGLGMSAASVVLANAALSSGFVARCVPAKAGNPRTTCPHSARA